MKFHIQFQQLAKGADRPTDHPSASDFTVEDGAFGLLPNVGDYVVIEPMGDPHAPRYSGKVASRLFTFFGADACGINIVVADDDDDWGKLIKE